MRLGLVDLLIPRVCPLCDTPRGDAASTFCRPCQDGLRRLAQLRDVPTVFDYEDRAARLIRRFKYDGRRDSLDFFAEELAARCEAIRFDVIVPVPRHWRRVRKLGADPVYELAQRLGHRLRRPVWNRALRRRADTRSQTGLNPEQRRSNVAGSFRARVPAEPRGVLLLDDVVTTGATLKEARRALRAASKRLRIYPVALAGTSRL